MSRFVAGISMDGACSWHRYNRVNELAGLFVVDSRVTAPGGRVYEMPAVAILDRGESGGLWLRFHPGVTGHECYIFDAGFVEHVRAMPPYGEPSALFPALGPASNHFALCSGGGGYSRWTVTVAAMQEIVEAFAPLLEVK